MDDIYQPFRMLLIWPVLVGCVAFYAVRFIASLLGDTFSRWQAIMAGITGLMAGIVTSTIAHQWNGSEIYWLAFTIGLAFAALVLFANAIAIILQAKP